MRTLLLVLAVLAASPVLAGPPNVVMLISDDQGWGDYSFMGHPHIRTPNLDRLASESLTFRRGYVPSSLCRASLATMVTGLYPHQHKITSNDPPVPAGKTGRALREDPTYKAQREAMISYMEKTPTLPRLLSEMGYLSYQSGKWWEGEACRCGGFTEGMTHGDSDKGGRHGDVGLTIGREGVRPVLDFMDRAVAAKKPFYVWYAPMMPHSPHNPPTRFLDRYKSKTPSLHVARYWAMCEWFDETCGAVLDYLERKGLARDTLIVYLCDNGWIQDPNTANYAPRSKRSPNDGGVRTPIMVRWTGKVMPRMADELAQSIDLAPTILSAVGGKRTAEMRGINLMDEAALKARTTIFGEIFEHNAVDIHNPAANLQYRWVIEGARKLILPAKRMGAAAKTELFDLQADPLEMKNLAEAQPEEVSRLRNLLDAWWKAGD